MNLRNIVAGVSMVIIALFAANESAEATVIYDFDGTCDDASHANSCAAFGSSDGGQVRAFIELDESDTTPGALIETSDLLQSQFIIGDFSFFFEIFKASISDDLMSLSIMQHTWTNTIDDGTFRYRVAERCPGRCDWFGASRQPIVSGSTPGLVANIAGQWSLRSVPEPTTVALMALGVTCLGMRRRRYIEGR